MTFRGKLSFQRSECTAGLTLATDFVCCVLKTILCKSPGTSMSTLRNTSTHTCTSVTMSVGRCMSTSIFTSSSMGLCDNF